ncbi:MAG: phosphate/phosphite/phosphonate ABC transporter substrate-binding protein [Deltaproteobacteria bacterium]|nr:phosphate/phosphite/phosphonate ABC transporter substrate-binding protein [Deltaproteobacteria bacterium]
MLNKRRVKGWKRWITYVGCLMTFVLSLSLIRAEILWGEEKPKILRMALIPAEDIEEMIRAFAPAKQYLEKELGVRIEEFKATDYTAVVEAMRAKKIDVAFFGPFSYVLAAKRANAKAIIGGSIGDGRLATYHSIFVTHRESGLRNMEDVKDRAKKLTVSFVDPASTSGHLIPRGHLESIGIRVDKDFKEIIFAGGHDASILAVKARKVDLGATWEGPYKSAQDKGLIASEDVFVIWKSESIPRSPFAVRGDMDESFVQRIQRAFLDMPQKAPEAFKQFEGRWERNKSYVAVTDKDYDYIRQVAKGLGMI